MLGTRLSKVTASVTGEFRSFPSFPKVPLQLRLAIFPLAPGTISHSCARPNRLRSGGLYDSHCNKRHCGTPPCHPEEDPTVDNNPLLIYRDYATRSSPSTLPQRGYGLVRTGVPLAYEKRKGETESRPEHL